MKTITEKIPGGKLVTIKVDFGSKIKKVQILGDFFMHPEEGVLDIEKKFIGLDLKFDEKKTTSEIEEMIKSRSYELIGVDIPSVVSMVKRSLK